MDYIAQVKAQILQIQYKIPPRVTINQNDPIKAFNEECDFIYKNKFRNRILLKLSCTFDNNALIMVDRIEHGTRIAKYLKANMPNKQVYWIRGDVETEDREKIKALMETNNNVVCVAMSRIFAVGVNIKNLHYVVFAQGGKAKITLIQSIGRGLRLHDSKTCLVIIDIADMLHYGTKHLLNRLDYYKDEEIEYETKDLFEQ
jgi:superfamily II DNA or RNA helicase